MDNGITSHLPIRIKPKVWISGLVLLIHQYDLFTNSALAIMLFKGWNPRLPYLIPFQKS